MKSAGQLSVFNGRHVRHLHALMFLLAGLLDRTQTRTPLFHAPANGASLLEAQIMQGGTRQANQISGTAHGTWHMQSPTSHWKVYASPLAHGNASRAANE